MAVLTAASTPLWTEGDPKSLAKSYYDDMNASCQSQGTTTSKLFVAAAASAAVSDVVALHGHVNDSARRQIENIISTAKAIEALLDAGPLCDPEMDDQDEQPHARGPPRAASSRSSLPKPPPRRRSPMDPILAAATKGILPHPGSSSGAGAATPAAGGASGSAARAGPKLPDRTPTATCVTDTTAGITTTSSTAADRSSSTHGNSNSSNDSNSNNSASGGGLPLPGSVTQAVLCRLDARAAAAAAVSCVPLAAAHRAMTTFSLSPPFVAHLTALNVISRGAREGFSDGSTESDHYVKFPLDGSPLAGGDLVEDASLRQSQAASVMVGMMREMRRGPGGEDWLRRARHPERPIVRPPHPRSSPLACFKNSRRVPLRGAAASYPTHGSSATSGPTSASEPEPQPQPSSGGGGGKEPCRGCLMTQALCDVQHLDWVPADRVRLHCDGGILAVAHATGWKQRDPGLGALPVASLPRPGATARGRGAPGEEVDDPVERCWEQYDTGFFDYVARVCADSGNGLVWAAADNGDRIKAFRAPQPAATRLAGCNRGDGNGMSLQYTLNSHVPGLPGWHVGLHVLGTKVMSIKGSGALLLWDTASLEPQRSAHHPSRVRRCNDDSDEYDDDDDDDDNDDDDDDEQESVYSGCVDDMREVDDPGELEVTKGAPPNAVYLLPSFKERNGGGSGGRSGGGAARAPLARRAPFQAYDEELLRRTALLADAAAPTGPTIAAALGGANMLLTWDLETQRLRQCLFGHLFQVTDLAAPPPGWGTAHLFASCALSGDVKVWDLRLRGGGAAVTLVTGGSESMHSVVLAAAAGCDGCGGGGTALGAGMICFAGGDGEAVWAWDLRAGGARPLYELSTGNTQVRSLAWDTTTCSLFAGCEQLLEDRYGGCSRGDWRRAKVPIRRGENAGAGVGASGAGEEDDEDEDEEDDFHSASRSPVDERVVRRLWPIRAIHQPEHFGRAFSLAESAVLRYQFWGEASCRVPATVPPLFGY